MPLLGEKRCFDYGNSDYEYVLGIRTMTCWSKSHHQMYKHFKKQEQCTPLIHSIYSHEYERTLKQPSQIWHEVHARANYMSSHSSLYILGKSLFFRGFISTITKNISRKLIMPNWTLNFTYLKKRYTKD